MGFGLSAVGFAMLMMWHVGLDLVGYLLIFKGFWGVASELKDYKGYKIAAIFAAACAPFAAVNLYNFAASFEVVPEPARPVLAVKGVCISLLTVVFTFAYCNSTARIAADGGARFFALRARITAYLTALYMALTVVYSFTGVDGSAARLIIVGQYVVLILNFLLLFTCFTTITTKKRYAVEQEIIERETEELVRKRALKNKKKGQSQEEEDK